jgi:hypothetical protein
MGPKEKLKSGKQKVEITMKSKPSHSTGIPQNPRKMGVFDVSLCYGMG